MEAELGRNQRKITSNDRSVVEMISHHEFSLHESSSKIQAKIKTKEKKKISTKSEKNNR